jgi:hypothetical protein
VRRAFGAHLAAHRLDRAAGGATGCGRQLAPMQNILALLKKPSTYVLILIGVVFAFAYGRFFGPVKTVASKLPGGQA